MKIFDDLAAQVEKEWLKTENNPDVFVELATTALRKFKYDWAIEKFDSELKDWLIDRSALPHQMSVHNTFGQPSITFFNNGRFVVDLYIWVDFDTSIHSHGFRGAFRLLHGESLQEIFHAPTVQNIAEDIRLVDLSKIEFAHLKQNDVQEIAAGVDLTHRVVHLANPTVTLCIKTINEPDLKQWNYLSTGLAIQKQNLSDDLVKKIYFYQYLLVRGEELADQFLNSFLFGLNISTQIHVYEAVASGGLDLNENTVGRLTESIVTRHEKSKWWPAYEKAHLDQMNEIRFEEFQKPLERMVAHFKNCGYNLAEIQKLDNISLDELNRLAKWVEATSQADQ